MLKPYFNGKLGNQKSRNVDKGKGYLFKNSPSHRSPKFVLFLKYCIFIDIKK